MNKSLFVWLFLGFFTSFTAAQDPVNNEGTTDSLSRNLQKQGVSVDSIVTKKPLNPLAPSKAAFYSAVLPGLGQIYNRRYWKVPIVYIAMGTSMYAYVYNDDLYDRFRSAFKRRRAGFIDDEFYDVNESGINPGNPDLSDQAIQDAQERYQRDRDLALVITIALYALNIIDANVDSHLRQFNVDDDLSTRIQPYIEYNPVTADPNYGLSLTIKF